MPLNLTPADQARYWSKVDVRGPDDCWPWTAGCFTSGYGQFWLRGTNVRAHRVAKELAGALLEGRGCHTCDNPPCCNPAHVFDGTDQSNLADRDAKGRQARGERHGMSKLTFAQATEIRALYATGRYSQPQLGKRLGVVHSVIGGIVRGELWKAAR